MVVVRIKPILKSIKLHCNRIADTSITQTFACIPYSSIGIGLDAKGKSVATCRLR
jgi:hypothetical protein